MYEREGILINHIALNQSKIDKLAEENNKMRLELKQLKEENKDGIERQRTA